MNIHTTLGPGFSEDIDHCAVKGELMHAGIPFESQKEILVEYKGQQLGVYRLDLVVDGKIGVELKAVQELNELFKQQVLSYLKVSHLKLGLLVNFGAPRLQIHRIVH